MKTKSIFTLLVATLLSVAAMNTFAADEDQTKKDETTVLGACMIQSIKANVPGISQDKIDKCADADPKDLPKCVGMTDDNFVKLVQACNEQLKNANCVSAKLKVKLIDYADCGYEKDPQACYKTLGTSLDAIKKLSDDCAAGK